MMGQRITASEIQGSFACRLTHQWLMWDGLIRPGQVVEYWWDIERQVHRFIIDGEVFESPMTYPPTPHEIAAAVRSVVIRRQRLIAPDHYCEYLELPL